MGWGEVRTNPHARCDALAAAVRAFLRRPTTGNQERLQQASDTYDAVDGPT